MASQDVIASALLLPIPLVSLALSAFNWFHHSPAPTKGAVFVLLTVLAAAAGGTALSAACGQPLRVVAKVFAALLHVTMSSISMYALSPSSQTPAFPPPFLGFFLSLAALLVACELLSTLIPPSPLLLPATLALVSRGILLTVAIATTVLLHRRHSAIAAEMNIEKGRPTDASSGRSPGRVSSPTLATWPFPGSLALQKKMDSGSSRTNKLTPSDLSPPSMLTHNVNVNSSIVDRQSVIILPLVVAITQVFASLSASLNVAASILVDGTTIQTDQPLSCIRLASAACTLLWSFAVLVVVQMLPAKPRACSSEKQVAMGCEQGPLGGDLHTILRDNHVPRTPKSSLSRRESDTLLDFLSLRDPFASSPPPPPPLPPIGLGLDEVDVGWNGSREIGMQYRFPAPRSIAKGGRRKGKKDRPNGNKRLLHQDSARMLLPVPETRGAEADAERDKGFGDEARLAELLLQSLSEDGDSPNTPIPPVPLIQSPQAAHVQQISRWSTSTTVQSIMSGSISNRSGVSTYTTCGSEKVPTSRISMNTIASVLGGRKSEEAKRKSSLTASSSKG